MSQEEVVGSAPASATSVVEEQQRSLSAGGGKYPHFEVVNTSKGINQNHSFVSAIFFSSININK